MTAFKAMVSVCVLAGLVAGTANALNMETVPVGNAGNAADTEVMWPDGTTGYGGVAYDYRIGTYEVTAGQYCDFLNKTAATDTYGLYSTNMDTAVYYLGCNIKRSGVSGSYTYTVASDWANRPVNYVSWGDSARFSNWMHNGQPTGSQNASTTEDGSYYLNGATSDEALQAVMRKANPTWVIPSDDEWYKSAYHKNDGVTGNYFDHPTSSDSVPSNVLGDPTDPGNNATYHNNGNTIGSPYYRTEVGAHENSDSPYGTFDQGGNVQEWNEAVIYGSLRGLRGGSFFDVDYGLRASFRNYGAPTFESSAALGFRVAEVPEAATAGLFLLGGLPVARCRRAPR